MIFSFAKKTLSILLFVLLKSLCIYKQAAYNVDSTKKVGDNTVQKSLPALFCSIMLSLTVLMLSLHLARSSLICLCVSSLGDLAPLCDHSIAKMQSIHLYCEKQAVQFVLLKDYVLYF